MARADDSGVWYPRWFWPAFAAPAVIWVSAFFVVPFYVIVSVAFGGLDPIFLSPLPEYNPVQWDTAAFSDVVGQLFTAGSVTQTAFIRTFVYVAAATVLCLLIGYPVAYFIARHAGRFKAWFLVALLAPFWISYMMRMLAWTNLLQNDGYVNRILEALGVLSEPRAWLEGKPSTVILGLVYGYIPYMILPLYAALDRIDSSALEAARDLGAGQTSTFLRVTVPQSIPAIVAGVVIVTLPMSGDYYTQDLLSASRNTAMLGNVIDGSIQSSLVQTGASLVLILLVVLLVPMLSYLRSTSRASAASL
ncbi:MAG: ABC transporter permease [Actinomycetota bacterium]